MRKILEPFGPLSKSTIWKRVAEVYRLAGLATWQNVPALVTGNALVGYLFAGALEAWLLDEGDAIDVDEPLYVVELGAGTGLFSHHFLTAVARRRARGMFPHPQVILVMCDQSEAQIGEWAEAKVLAAHADAGTLDFATVAVDDQGRMGSIALKRCGTTLSRTRNPVVVVANYFFDSIPTDAFRVRDGKVFEARTRFVKVREAPAFEGYQNEEKIVNVGAHHYGDVILDGILASYARDYPEASILMPIAGIRCVQALMELSDARVLLLSIDKGSTTPDRMKGWFDQAFTCHGNVFSYMVNFDAFRRYFEANEGRALCSSSDDRALVCFVGTLPALARADGNLKRFFVDQIDSIDALNAYVSLTKGIHALPQLTDASGVAPLMDLLAAMHADPDAFSAIMYRTVDVVRDAPTGVRRLARQLAAIAKENFFSPRFNNDVFYWSGRLHYMLGDLDIAKQDFEASILNYPRDSRAHFFLGVLAEERADIESARHSYTRHLQVDPDCPATRDALERVR